MHQRKIRVEITFKGRPRIGERAFDPGFIGIPQQISDFVEQHILVDHGLNVGIVQLQDAGRSISGRHPLRQTTEDPGIESQAVLIASHQQQMDMVSHQRIAQNLDLFVSQGPERKCVRPINIVLLVLKQETLFHMIRRK